MKFTLFSFLNVAEFFWPSSSRNSSIMYGFPCYILIILYQLLLLLYFSFSFHILFSIPLSVPLSLFVGYQSVLKYSEYIIR